MDIVPVAIVGQLPVLLYSDPKETVSGLRSAYRFFTLTIFFCALILVTINVTVSDINVSNTTEILYITLGFFVAAMKVACYWKKRETLWLIFDLLRDDICRPRTITEEISAKRSNFLHRICVIFAISAYVSVSLCFIFPFQIPLAERPLPLHIYRLYDMSNGYIYAATYVLCELSLVYAISYTVFPDLILYELFDRLMVQFSLLSCRFETAVRALGHETASLSRSVAHHVHLRKIMDEITSFYATLFTQYVLFCLLAISSLFVQATKKRENIIETIQINTYLLSLLLQLCLYCFLGDALHVKTTTVTQAIYNSDWVSLKPKNRKYVILILLCTQEKMDITNHGIAQMNINTLKWVVRTTYSIFNILKQVQQKM